MENEENNEDEKYYEGDDDCDYSIYFLVEFYANLFTKLWFIVLYLYLLHDLARLVLAVETIAFSLGKTIK